jgi:hypothetical protein
MLFFQISNIYQNIDLVLQNYHLMLYDHLTLELTESKLGLLSAFGLGQFKVNDLSIPPSLQCQFLIMVLVHVDVIFIYFYDVLQHGMDDSISLHPSTRG